MKKLVAVFALLASVTSSVLMANALAMVSDPEVQGTSSATPLCVDMQSGSRDAATGGQVTVLQKYLNDNGYLSSLPTGYYGSQTLSAVYRFQRAILAPEGVRANGLTGPITRAKINSLQGLPVNVCQSGNTNTISGGTPNPTPSTQPTTAFTPFNGANCATNPADPSCNTLYSCNGVISHDPCTNNPTNPTPTGPSPALTASIQVTSPNTFGVSKKIGDTFTITWNGWQSRTTPTTLSLYLVSTDNSGSSGSIRLLPSTSNIQPGSYTWEIPESIFAGDVGMPLTPGNYKIRATLYEGNVTCLGFCAPSSDGASAFPRVIATDDSDIAFYIEPKSDVAPESIISAVKSRLASKLGVSIYSITTVSSNSKLFTNGCLDIPQPIGMACTSVMVEGYVVIVSYNGTKYTYHTNGRGSQIAELVTQTESTSSLAMTVGNSSLPIITNITKKVAQGICSIIDTRTVVGTCFWGGAALSGMSINTEGGMSFIKPQAGTNQTINTSSSGTYSFTFSDSLSQADSKKYKIYLMKYAVDGTYSSPTGMYEANIISSSRQLNTVYLNWDYRVRSSSGATGDMVTPGTYYIYAVNTETGRWTTVSAFTYIMGDTTPVAPKTVTVTYPNGGEQLAVNTEKDVDFRVYWTSTNMTGKAYVYLNAMNGAMCLLGETLVEKQNFGVKVGPNFPCPGSSFVITSGQYKIVLATDTPSPTGDQKGINDSSDSLVNITVAATPAPVTTTPTINTVTINEERTQVTVQGTNLGSVDTLYYRGANNSPTPGFLISTLTGVLSRSSTIVVFSVTPTLAQSFANPNMVYYDITVKSGANTSNTFRINQPTITTQPCVPCGPCATGLYLVCPPSPIATITTTPLSTTVNSPLLMSGTAANMERLYITTSKPDGSSQTSGITYTNGVWFQNYPAGYFTQPGSYAVTLRANSETGTILTRSTITVTQPSIGSVSIGDPVLVSSSPVSQFVVGGTTFGIATFKVATVQSGTSAIIRELRFTTTGLDAIETITVAGVTANVIGSGSNTYTTISGLNIPISSLSVEIPVTVKFSGFQNSTTGGSLQTTVPNVSISLAKVEATSNGVVITNTTPVSSNMFTLVASKPTVTVGSGGGSPVVFGVEDKIGEFTVSADPNGKIALSSVSVLFSHSGLTNSDLSGGRIADANGTIQGSSLSRIGSYLNFSFAYPYEIMPGQSKTFSVYLTVLGQSQSSSVSPYVTTRLTSADTFVWKDVVGGNTTQTGEKIYNFPTNSFIRTVTTQTTVPAPTINYFTASAYSGQSSTLAWSSNATQQCSIKNTTTGESVLVGGQASGSKVVSPTQTTTYTLTCTSVGYSSGPTGSSGGLTLSSSDKMVTVNVGLAPSPVRVSSVSPATPGALFSINGSGFSSNGNTVYIDGYSDGALYNYVLGSNLTSGGNSLNFTLPTTLSPECGGSSPIVGCPAPKPLDPGSHTLTVKNLSGMVSNTVTFTVSSPVTCSSTQTLTNGACVGNPPRTNAMNCSSPRFTNQSPESLACYGVWDYDDAFGQDKDMCGDMFSPTTGCKVTTTACSSGQAVASKYVLVSSASTGDIATMASNLKVSADVLSNHMAGVWVYTCTAPEGTQAIGYGVYRGVATPGSTEEGVVRVTLPTSAEGKVLVLTGFQSVNWIIENPNNVRIRKVIAIGYNTQRVTGLPGVEVESHSYTTDRVYKFAYANTGSGFNSLVSWLAGRGVTLTSANFKGAYSSEFFSYASSYGLVLGASTSSVCTDLPFNFHRGNESPSTKKLQSFLIDKGFMEGEVTGFYGDKTVSAIKDYQMSKGLPITGMVYDFTRAAIKADTCQ